MRKRKSTPRQIVIMLAGYVISATLGLAIGYYILMRIDPSYNWLHLRLPGLFDTHFGPAAALRPPGQR